MEIHLSCITGAGNSFEEVGVMIGFKSVLNTSGVFTDLAGLRGQSLKCT